MEIRIRKSVAEEVGLPKFVPFGINKDSWGWKEEADLNLAAMERDKIDDLRAVLIDHDEVRGVPTILRDIDTWLTALVDPDSIAAAQPRSPRQLEPLLIRVIGQNQRRHVYMRFADMDDVWLAYYVSKIEYRPREVAGNGRVIPEHTNIHYYYEDFRGRHSDSETFWLDDCKNMTVVEALAKKGFYLETPTLRKKYLSEVKRFNTVCKQIGKQFLAYGKATDGEVDGNPGRSDHWYYRKTHNYTMARKDGPTKVLIDIFKEDEEKEREDRDYLDTWFWTIKAHLRLIHAEDGRASKKGRRFNVDDEEDLLESLDVPTPEIEIPIHPFCIVFDLKKHLRLKIHVSYLADYKYDKQIIDRLILPDELKDLVRMLIEHEEAKFEDIVQGKSGGAVVLLTGKPGVGKTLTAEVYAESEERGLYSVQCSQLGTNPDKLEEELLKVFSRAQRWGAVLLLDEADVYVKERGSDLHQNAIVGVFLRVLEYQGNVLFLTTNRPDDVDDAIASRCVARLCYQPPTPEDQAKIWRVLSRASKIDMTDETIYEIVDASPGISGRDVKNLLKLANLVALSRGHKITPEMVEFAKKFKPTK